MKGTMTMPNSQMQYPDVGVNGATSVLGRPSSTSPDARVILERAQALVPKLRERMVETEQLRRLPDATIADAEEAGLFGLLLPKSLGGAGGDGRDFVQLVRILAHGHLGACWTLAFLVEHNYMLARFPKECQDEVFIDGKPAMMSGVISPPGKAVAVDGGYLISGRWGYATAVMHADWFQGSAIIEGTEDPILFLVPREEVEVEDTWHMSGMQATGSHHVTIDSQFVPAYRCPNIDHWASRGNPGSFHPEPLYHAGLRDLIGFMYPAMAVGAAEVLLEEFRERIERRRQPFSSKVVADTGAGQLRYARAFGALQTARATLAHTVEQTIRADEETDGELSPDVRAGFKLALMSVLRMAWESIDLGIRGSGTSIYASGASTQHYLRDVEIMLSHQTIDEDAMYSITGEILLGRATDSYLAII
jgi:alkylation response protein AidB-like acyl-CoA dehydrogenase